jgi:hypothetical protein
MPAASYTAGSVEQDHSPDNLQESIDESLMMPSLNRLDQLAKLSRNWDSYDGDAPTAQALNTARNFLLYVQGQLGGWQRSVRPDKVAALADGGIHLRWKGQNFEIEIESDSDGKLGYLFVDKRGEDEEYVEKDSSDWGQLVAYIAKVMYT